MPITAHTPAPAALLALLCLLLAGPAAAQYKVIGPDGSVTYTDRAPVEAGAKVQAMRRDGSLAAAAAASAVGASSNPPVAPLPFELRAVVARFPVVLYTTTHDCAPCLQGRNLLTQRGVPYSERSVTSDDDIAALQRLTGGRSVPALSVGAQALRGFQEQDWQATLDLAGYPKESRLPRGWLAQPISPLVAQRGPSRAAGEPINITGEPAGAAGSPPALPAAPAASGGIRF